jgi:hypothetical protein
LPAYRLDLVCRITPPNANRPIVIRRDWRDQPIPSMNTPADKLPPTWLADALDRSEAQVAAGQTVPLEPVLDRLRASIGRLQAAETERGGVLVAALRASPHPDLEIDPRRDRMPVRDVDM